MARYIDADALYEKTAELEASAFATIEKLKRTLLEKMDENKKAEWLRWTAILGERIAFKYSVFDAPTADVVEVVRCKDCKWSVEHYDTDGNVPYWVCKNWYDETDANGFCYDAERRDDGEIH